MEKQMLTNAKRLRNRVSQANGVRRKSQIANRKSTAISY
jgi:hypothetical protein